MMLSDDSADGMDAEAAAAVAAATAGNRQPRPPSPPLPSASSRRVPAGTRQRPRYNPPQLPRYESSSSYSLSPEPSRPSQPSPVGPESASSRRRRPAASRATNASGNSTANRIALPLLLRSINTFPAAGDHVAQEIWKTHPSERSIDSFTMSATQSAADGKAASNANAVSGIDSLPQKPYFLDEHILHPQALLDHGFTPVAPASPLLSSVDDAYELHSWLRHLSLHNIANNARQRARKSTAKRTSSDASAKKLSKLDTSMSSMLLSGYLDNVSSIINGTSNNLIYAEQFAEVLENALRSQTPLSVNLTSQDQAHHERIAQICVSLCQSSLLATHNPALLQRIRELVVRYLLGLGGTTHALQTVKFLLQQHRTLSPSASTTPNDIIPLRCASYVHQYTSKLDQYKRTVIRLSRYKHLTDISHAARRVKSWPRRTDKSSAITAAEQTRKLYHGRRWDWEDETTGWERYDEQVSAQLEEAYQQGQPYLDFTVDGQHATYRADFDRMVQRNLHTNRERPLRSLLALLIKEKSGVISQTVEINMPHGTLIKELRKELAQYLKKDEKLLRLTYNQRVLKRDDYANLSIREAIVPLGAGPLVVTKMAAGDSEDLCTYVLTGLKPVRQPAYECLTCDFVDGRTICAVCADVCHRGHETRLVGTSVASFCHDGAGVSDVPCKALESTPQIDQTFHATMTMHPHGTHVYILTAEHGLIQLGTGKGGTVLGKVYKQHTQLAAHAGAHIAATTDVIYMRTPLLDKTTMLVIDATTLQLRPERVVLDTPARPQHLQQRASWEDTNDCIFEYGVKSDHDDSDAIDNVTGSIQQMDDTLPSNLVWHPLPAPLATKLRHILCTNWSYGQHIWQSEHDHSLLSIVLEEEGCFLRRPTKLGLKRSRIRMRHPNQLMPIYVRSDTTLLALNLDAIASSDSPRSKRASAADPRRRREHALVVDIFKMPQPLVDDKTGGQLTMQHCATCGGITSPDNNECSLCNNDVPQPMQDISSPGVELDSDLRTQLRELQEMEAKRAMEEQSRALSQRNNGTAARPARSMPSHSQQLQTHARALESSLAQQLMQLGFSRQHAAESVVATQAETLEEAIEWLMQQRTQLSAHEPLSIVSTDSEQQRPARYLQATAADATQTLAPTETQPAVTSEADSRARPPALLVEQEKLSPPEPLRISYSRCSLQSRRRLDVAVNAYKNVHDLANTGKKYICDGCGLTAKLNAPSHVAASTPLLACMDKQCKNLYLCSTCSAMGLWQHRHHSDQHAMKSITSEAVADADTEVDSELEPDSLSLDVSATTADDVISYSEQRLVLGEFATYYDRDQNTLTFFRWSPAQLQQKQCYVFDASTGICMVTDVTLNTKSDAFVLDPLSHSVWTYSSHAARLVRWETVRHSPVSAALMQLAQKPQQSVSSSGSSLMLEEKKEAEEDLGEKDSIDSLEAASLILHHLPTFATSSSSLVDALTQLVEVAELIFSPASLAHNHAPMRSTPIAVDALHLLSSCLRRATSALRADVQIFDPHETTIKVLFNRTRALIEHSILHFPPTVPTSTSHSAHVTSSSQAQQLDELIVHEASVAFVEGYELFYPTWKARMTRLESMMHVAVADTDDKSGIAPAARKIVQLLSDRYHDSYVGLRADHLQSLGSTDTTVVAQATVSAVNQMVRAAVHYDQSNLSLQRSHEHPCIQAVLAYYLHLSAFAMSDVPVHSDISRTVTLESPFAVDRRLRDDHHSDIAGNRAERQHKQAHATLTHLAIDVFSYTTALLNQHMADATESSTAAAKRAVESLHSTSIGTLLPWCIHSLPHLRTSYVAYSDVQLLTSATVTLLCTLSQIYAQARGYAPDSRRKIAALRQTGQLLQVVEAGINGNLPTTPTAVKPRHKNQCLTPFAAEVLTDVFSAFASSPGGMSRTDFTTYLRHLMSSQTLTHEQLLAQTLGIYRKYASTPLHSYGDEPDLLSLGGFLSMVTDLAVDNSGRVLHDLRLMEHRYQFNRSEPVSQLLDDLKTSFGDMLRNVCSSHTTEHTARGTAVIHRSVHPVKNLSVEEQVQISLGLAPLPGISPSKQLPRRRPSLASLRQVSSASMRSSDSDLSVFDAASTVAATLSTPVDPSRIDELLNQDTIVRFMNSQDQYRTQPTYRQRTQLLQLFINAPRVDLSVHRSKASDERPAAAENVFGDDAVAHRLSELVQRCLREMYGNTPTLAAQWTDIRRSRGAIADIFSAEKAMAAALIKHNNLAEAFLQYGRSLDITRLLVSAQRKGTRCMFQPTLPDWIKKVIRATYRHVSEPIYQLLRQRQEARQSSDMVSAIEGSRAIDLTFSGDSPLSDQVQAADHENAEEAKDQTGSPLASAVASERFASAMQASDDMTVSISSLTEATTSVDAATPPSAINELNDELMVDDEVEQMVRRYALNALYLVEDGGASLTRNTTPRKPSTAQPAHGFGGSRPALTNESMRYADGSSGMLTSIASDDDLSEDTISVTAGGEDDSLLLQRAQSDLLTTPTNRQAAAAATAGMPVSTHLAHRERLSMMLDTDAATYDNAPAPLSAMGRRQSEYTFASSTPSRPNTALSSWAGTSMLPDSYNHITAPAVDAYDMSAALQPSSPMMDEAAVISLDSDWIVELVQTDALLSPMLSTTLPALATALSFRVQLLLEVNSAFRSGHTEAVVDDLLPMLHRAKLVKYIQSSSSVRSRQPETDDALLFFYKHLGSTLLQQSFQPTQRHYWLRIVTILHFLNVEFQPQDSDILLGSGLLLTLCKFIQFTDEQVKAMDSSSLAGSQYTSDDRAMAGRVKSWTWRIFVYLTTFLLTQPVSKKSRQQRYVLAATVGQQLGSILTDHLQRINLLSQQSKAAVSRSATGALHASMWTESLWPLQQQHPLHTSQQTVDELVYRSVDMAHLLQLISADNSVLSRDNVVTLIRSMRSETGRPCLLPTIVQQSIVQLLRSELPHHSPVAIPVNAATTPTSRPTQPTTPSLDLAQELVDTLESMQLQHHLLAALEVSNGTLSAVDDRAEAAEESNAEVTSRSLIGSSSKALHLPDHQLLDPLQPINREELKRASQFRRIAVLLCPQCKYLEFPACGLHKSFLTREVRDPSGQNVHAACADKECESNTAVVKLWTRCQSCRKVRANVQFWLLHESEAIYCAKAIKQNASAVISHNVFLCNICKVAEFPGTKHGGLTLNVEGRLFDKASRRFYPTQLYEYHHFTGRCPGKMHLTPVRLSQEEASYLGSFIQRTPPIDPTKPPHSSVHPAHSRITAALPSGQQQVAHAWGYSSWKPTAHQMQLISQEMIDTVRLLMTTSAPAPSPAASPTPDGSAVSPNAQSPNRMPLPVLIRQQWRESMAAYTRQGLSAILDALHMLQQLSSPTQQLDASIVQHARTLLLPVLSALAIAGGSEDMLRKGAPITFRSDGQTMHGWIASYDSQLSTVAVRLRRDVKGDAAVGGCNDCRQQGVGDNTVGTSGIVGAAINDHGLIQLPIDEVTVMPTVPPPSLQTVGWASVAVPLLAKALAAPARPASTDSNATQLLFTHVQQAIITLLHNQHSTLLQSSASLDALFAALIQLSQATPVQMQLVNNQLLHSSQLLHQYLQNAVINQQADSASLRHRQQAFASLRAPHPYDRLPATQLAAIQATAKQEQIQRDRDRLLQGGPPDMSRRGSRAAESVSADLDAEEVEEEQAPPPRPTILARLDQLLAMGFDTATARFALAAARGDIEAATNAILSDPAFSEGSIDPTVASERWEALIDRMNIRAAVDAYMMYQAAQQAEAAERAQAEAEVEAAIERINRSGSHGKHATNDEIERQRQRRLAAIAPCVWMSNRFQWPDEEWDQMQTDSSSSSSNRAHMLSSAQQAHHIDPVQTIRRLAADNLLVGRTVVITEEAIHAFQRPYGSLNDSGQDRRYRVGDRIYIVDLVNKVCPADVVEVAPNGQKIYLHYTGWSKKWDEWTDVSSTRIQPQYKVGDRLTVYDTVGKEAEVVVMDLAVRDNTLKILIHYEGFGSKWDEWLSVHSKRILHHHRGPRTKIDPELLADDQPTEPPFTMVGRVGTVLKVDKRDNDGREMFVEEDESMGVMALVQIVDHSLHQTVYAWLRLNTLRLVTGRALASGIVVGGNNVYHMPHIPPSNSSRAQSAASIEASRLSLPQLVAMATDTNIKLLSQSAVALIQDLTAQQLISGKHSQRSLRGSPSSPSTRQWLPQTLPVRQLLYYFAQQSATDTRTLLALAQHDDSPRTVQRSESCSATVGALDLLVQTLRQQIIDLEKRSRPLPSLPTWLTDIADLLHRSSDELKESVKQLHKHQVTVMQPGNTQTIEQPPSTTVQLVTFLPEMDIVPDKANVPQPASSLPVWNLRFYSDAQKTILLKECIITGEVTSRQVAPFLVSNPVYIEGSPVAAKQRLKRKELSQLQATLSVTPLTLDHLEAMFLTVDLLIKLRRSLPASLSDTTSVHSSFIPHFHNLLHTAYHSLLGFVRSTHRSIGLPSNMKLRVYETLTAIMLVAGMHIRHNRSVIFINAAPTSTTISPRSSQQQLSPQAARWMLDVKPLVELVVPEAKTRFNKEKLHGPLASVYLQRLIELLVAAVQYERLSAPPSTPTHRLFPTSARRIVGEELPVVSAVERLMLLAADPRAHPLLDKDGSGSQECECDWCLDRQTNKEFAAVAVPLIDMADNCSLRVLLHDMDHDPDSRPEHVASTTFHPSTPSRELTESQPPWSAQLSTLFASFISSTSPAHQAESQPRAPARTPRNAVPPSPSATRSSSGSTIQLQSEGAPPLLSPTVATQTSVPDSDALSAASARLGRAISVPMTALGERAPTGQYRQSLPTIEQEVSPTVGSNTNASQQATPRNATVQVTSVDQPITIPIHSPSSSAQHFHRPRVQHTPRARIAHVDASSFSSDWRTTTNFAERLFVNPAFRNRMFNLLLNATAANNLPRPEIAFRRGTENEEVYSAREKEAEMHNNSMTKMSMFHQLADAFLKAQLHSKPAALRAEVGAVTWKTTLAGALDQGAAGLPGPFRQALYEICQYINKSAASPFAGNDGELRQDQPPTSTALTRTSSTDPTHSAAASGKTNGQAFIAPQSPLFITSPNSRSQTGDDRDKLIVNPGLTSEWGLVQYRIFGQLMGIAIRSKCCLDLELAETIWKLLLHQPLPSNELATFDYTAYKSLLFADPTNDIEFTEEEYYEYLPEMTWTTILSDGKTTVELCANGAARRVKYEDRWDYARAVNNARLHESVLQIGAMRDGLQSVVPASALRLLTWSELELRVCGRSTIDLEVLKRHTVYSPSAYTLSSPIVQQFWQVLGSFSQKELGQFLQFAWARSRLPSESGTYRMQVNILDTATQQALPTAETCFFNVNIPKYDDINVMREKIRVALLCATITS